MHPVALTAEVSSADVLEALNTFALPEGALDDAIGEAAGLIYGLEWLFADLIYAFNSIASLVLTPISWIPFVGPLAASLIWTPINLVESFLWYVFVGGVYYPYFAEATDPGLTAELAEVAGLDFGVGVPELALEVDAVGFGIDAIEAVLPGLDVDVFGVDLEPLEVDPLGVEGGVESAVSADGVSDLGELVEAVEEVSETLLSLLG
ncbi:hypothetical protein A5715_05085 [Mycolicibacter heraklionensis]|nr:hypothetical protein A5715_05085 [Mycolicibacter heraklionensis]